MLTQTVSALIWKGYYIPLNMNGMPAQIKEIMPLFSHLIACIASNEQLIEIESMPTQIIKHTNKIINIEIISLLGSVWTQCNKMHCCSISQLTAFDSFLFFSFSFFFRTSNWYSKVQSNKENRKILLIWLDWW